MQLHVAAGRHVPVSIALAMSAWMDLVSTCRVVGAVTLTTRPHVDRGEHTCARRTRARRQTRARNCRNDRLHCCYCPHNNYRRTRVSCHQKCYFETALAFRVSLSRVCRSVIISLPGFPSLGFIRMEPTFSAMSDGYEIALQILGPL